LFRIRHGRMLIRCRHAPMVLQSPKRLAPLRDSLATLDRCGSPMFRQEGTKTSPRARPPTSALRRSSNVATATSVGGGRSGEISALVRAFRGFARLSKSLTKRRYTLHMPKKLFSWVFVIGNLACFRASTFFSCTCSCPGRTMCPRYSTSSENHVHSSKFRVTPASRRRCRTVSTSLTCCSAFAKKMMTSSK